MDIDQIARFANIDQLNIPEVVILMVAGAILLLAGYRIKKIAFFIIWFILGYNLALFLLPMINNLVPQIVGNDLWQFLIPIAGGLLLALLGFSIEKVCVGGICFALTMLITVQYFGTEMQTLAIGGVVGVILAGAAVMLMKPAIIIATAVAGAYAVTVGVLKLSTIDMAAYYWPLLIGSAALGSIVQFMTTKRVS